MVYFPWPLKPPQNVCLLITWTLFMCHKWTAAIYIIPPTILTKGHKQYAGCSLVWRPLELSLSSFPTDVTIADSHSDTGLQLAVEQGSVVHLQAGVDDSGVVSHPAPVRPAVTPLHLVQARHLFQAQHILKALLEIVRQEGVQNGVGTAVGVAEHHHKVEGALHGWRGLDRASDGGDVENIKRQPTKDEHRHHDGHHPCHFALRALALCGAHSYARWLNLGKKWTGQSLKCAACNINLCPTEQFASNLGALSLPKWRRYGALFLYKVFFPDRLNCGKKCNW